MVKIIGIVRKITTRIVTFRKLNYEQFLNTDPSEERMLGRSTEESIGWFYDGEMSLKYSNDVIDDLIKCAGKRFCELEIEKGVVASIKPFKTEKEIVEEYERKHLPREEASEPKSLRNKLRIILSTLVEMEREVGGYAAVVEKSALLDKLRLEFDIANEEAERLIKTLIREGTIYEARRGHLKKT